MKQPQNSELEKTNCLTCIHTQKKSILAVLRLTHKQTEMHGCILSNVATDGLVLKHQANSIHSADKVFIVLDQFCTNILHLKSTILENKLFQNNIS